MERVASQLHQELCSLHHQATQQCKWLRKQVDRILHDGSAAAEYNPLLLDESHELPWSDPVVTVSQLKSRIHYLLDQIRFAAEIMNEHHNASHAFLLNEDGFDNDQNGLLNVPHTYATGATPIISTIRSDPGCAYRQSPKPLDVQETRLCKRPRQMVPFNPCTQNVVPRQLRNTGTLPASPETPIDSYSTIMPQRKRSTECSSLAEQQLTSMQAQEKGCKRFVCGTNPHVAATSDQLYPERLGFDYDGIVVLNVAPCVPDVITHNSGRHLHVDVCMDAEYSQPYSCWDLHGVRLENSTCMHIDAEGDLAVTRQSPNVRELHPSASSRRNCEPRRKHPKLHKASTSIPLQSGEPGCLQGDGARTQQKTQRDESNPKRVVEHCQPQPYLPTTSIRASLCILSHAERLGLKELRNLMASRLLKRHQQYSGLPDARLELAASGKIVPGNAHQQLQPDTSQGWDVYKWRCILPHISLLHCELMKATTGCPNIALDQCAHATFLALQAAQRMAHYEENSLVLGTLCDTAYLICLRSLSQIPCDWVRCM